MIEVRVTDDFMVGGIAVYVAMKTGPGERLILHQRDGHLAWDRYEPGTIPLEPTLKLEDDAGRAVLDALLRYYQGASDMHTVRGDLLHERGRVDKLTDAMIAIARRDPP